MRRGKAPLTVICLVFLNHQTFAFEAYMNSPGSRAMSMAGVFSAQADDSSAIWYNPAGLAPSVEFTGDTTVEFAALPERSIDASEVTGLRYGDASSLNLKYAAYYRNQIPFAASTKTKSSFGVGYFRPYSFSININKSRIFNDPTSTQTFGIVDSRYQQISALYATHLTNTMAFGGTADFVWTDITCNNQAINCVGNGPSGFGATLGIKANIYAATGTRVHIAGVWRSRADLKYSDKPDSPVSLSSALEEYLPDRPESRNLGVNLQTRLQRSLLNINAMVEQVLWSKVDGVNQPISDYLKTGLSAEWLFTGRGGRWIKALRVGATLSDPDDTALGREITSLTLGAGLGFNHESFVDIAVEQRELDSDVDNNVTLFSISYSYQVN